MYVFEVCLLIFLALVFIGLSLMNVFVVFNIIKRVSNLENVVYHSMVEANKKDINPMLN